MSNVVVMTPKRDRPLAFQNIEVLDVVPEAVVEVPLLGNIAAGVPIEACPQQETVAVPYSMTRKDCYALKVVGDSMINDNIEHGDIIIVERKSTAENGQSVVALINGDSVTLKRFYIEKDGIRLQPANPAMKPIFLRNESLQILGIVTGVIRTPNGDY